MVAVTDDTSDTTPRSRATGRLLPQCASTPAPAQHLGPAFGRYSTANQNSTVLCDVSRNCSCAPTSAVVGLSARTHGGSTARTLAGSVRDYENHYIPAFGASPHLQ